MRGFVQGYVAVSNRNGYPVAGTEDRTKLESKSFTFIYLAARFGLFWDLGLWTGQSIE